MSLRLPESSRAPIDLPWTSRAGSATERHTGDAELREGSVFEASNP